jgi:hypothetical protein
MKKLLVIYFLIGISSCSEKKTDTDTIEEGVELDSIKKGDTVEIVPKVIEPADRTSTDTIDPII